MAKASARVKQIFMNGRSGRELHLWSRAIFWLIRAKNDVDAPQLTKISNRARKNQLLRTLAVASNAKAAGFGVPGSVLTGRTFRAKLRTYMPLK
jgi:hypothetical protein